MMEETAVDLMFEKISVIYAYAFQVQIERHPQIDRHQAAVHLSGKEMIFVMTIIIMQDATLMVETAVDPTFEKISVLNAYALQIAKLDSKPLVNHWSNQNLKMAYVTSSMIRRCDHLTMLKKYVQMRPKNLATIMEDYMSLAMQKFLHESTGGLRNSQNVLHFKYG